MQLQRLVLFLILFISFQNINCEKNFLKKSKSKEKAKSQEKKLYTIKLKKINQSQKDKKNFLNFLAQKQSVKYNAKQHQIDTAKHNNVLLQKKASIYLKNFDNTQYVGEVGVGNPPQFLDVVFDTGSTNFWVNSKLCNDLPCGIHAAYDHTKSRDYEEIGYELEVEFGTGVIKGIINKDTVTLGNIQIKDQEFGEITDERGSVFYDGKFSGILGLAYPEMSAFGFEPVFDSMMGQDVLDKDIFAFYFATNDFEDSTLTFGGWDNNLFEGDLTWTKVIDQYYWLINIEDVQLDGKSLGVCPCNAAVDSGTSLITAPPEIIDKVLEPIQVEDGCRNLADLPVLTFVIEGKKFSLNPEEYILTVRYDGLEEDPWEHSSSKYIEDCRAAIMPLDVPPPQGPLWVLGDIFLMKFYSVYDRERDRIGLARAKRF